MAAKKSIAKKSDRSTKSATRRTRRSRESLSAAKSKQRLEPHRAGSRVSPLDAARRSEATTKGTLLPAASLEEAIEHERVHLMQIEAMLKCLYEVLLYADDDDTIMHADVANVAARLIDDCVARLEHILRRSKTADS